MDRQTLFFEKGNCMDINSGNDLLAAWSDDADVTAARFAVHTEISAVELAQRVTKDDLYIGSFW
jgi:hypothetical protein